MGYSVTLKQPYYTGSGVTSTDTRWDVVIGGHSYMIDRSLTSKFTGMFSSESVSMIRNQADTGDRPGEQTLNPAGLWRRSVESWHHGAGQSYLDKPETDPYRFRTSKGVDPWTRYSLGLLPSTAQAQASANTNLYLAVGQNRLWMGDGQNVKFSAQNTVPGTMTNATGTPAATLTSLTTDGTDAYAAYGTSGIYKTAGSTAFSSYVTSVNAVTLVRFVKDRLIAAVGADLYYVSGAGAIGGTGTTKIVTNPISGWTWTDAAASPTVIHVSGYAGDKSLIYRVAIKSDGTGLDVPIVAAELPDGELVVSLTSYLGFLAVGTSKGVRFGTSDDTGNLTLGPLISTTLPVRASEGQDRFLWFGWSNYDATSSGLGRMDLSQFTDSLTPAYASDLMATAQGEILGVATVQGKRVFTVSGVGLYAEQTSKVASGTVSGGKVAFGLIDPKTALSIDVRHNALASGQSVSVAVAADDNAAVTAGTSSTLSTTNPPEPFTINAVRATCFEWTVTITGDTALRMVVLRVDPSADRSDVWTVPVLLMDFVEDRTGTTQPMDPLSEYRYLKSQRDTRQVITYAHGVETTKVVVDDTDWRPGERTADLQFFQGTFVLKLKETV